MERIWDTLYNWTPSFGGHGSESVHPIISISPICHSFQGNREVGCWFLFRRSRLAKKVNSCFIQLCRSIFSSSALISGDINNDCSGLRLWSTMLVSKYIAVGLLCCERYFVEIAGRRSVRIARITKSGDRRTDLEPVRCQESFGKPLWLRFEVELPIPTKDCTD